VNRASCPSRFTSGEGYPTLIEWVAGWDAESVSTLAEIELGFGILLPPYTADWTAVWGVVTSPFTDVTPVYFPASSSSSSAVPIPMLTQNEIHACLRLGVCCNIAMRFVRTFRALALPVDVFGPSSSDCRTRSLFSTLVLGRPESVPLQMQAVCTSFSCRFQILFVIMLNARWTIITQLELARSQRRRPLSGSLTSVLRSGGRSWNYAWRMRAKATFRFARSSVVRLTALVC